MSEWYLDHIDAKCPIFMYSIFSCQYNSWPEKIRQSKNFCPFLKINETSCCCFCLLVMIQHIKFLFKPLDYLVYYLQVYSAGLLWNLVRGNKLTHINTKLFTFQPSCSLNVDPSCPLQQTPFNAPKVGNTWGLISQLGYINGHTKIYKFKSFLKPSFEGV